MVTYDSMSQQQLKNKFNYELWLLDYFSNEKLFYGDSSLDSFIFKNNKFVSKGVRIFGEAAGGNHIRINLSNEMLPLTFVSSYKILDMIFEWILTMNSIFPPSHFWTFNGKITTIKNLDTTLTFPPFFSRYPDIKDHLFQLYEHLKDYRNEIVHNYSFSINQNSSPELHINYNNNPLIIDKEQMSYFVAITISVAKILIGNLQFEEKEILYLKYYLNQISNLHQSSLFQLDRPITLDVSWVLDLENNDYNANISYIKNYLDNYYPDREIRFNLIIAGTQENNIIKAWNFTTEDTLLISTSIIDLNNYNDKQISISIKEVNNLSKLLE